MKFRVHFNSERQRMANNKLSLVLLLLLLQLSILKLFVSASIKEIQYLHKNGTIITIDWPTAMGYSSQEEYDDWKRRRRASLHFDESSFHYDDNDYTHHDTTSDSNFDNDDYKNNDTGKEEMTTTTTTTTTNNERKLAPADCGPPENRFLATAITHLIGTSGAISNIGEEAAFINAFKTALSASSLCIRADQVIVRDQDLTELRRLDEEGDDDRDVDEPEEEEEEEEETSDFERFLKEEERQKHRKLRYWKLSVTVRVYGVCSRCEEMKSLSSDATRRGRRHLVPQEQELKGGGTDDDRHHYYRKLVVDYNEQGQQGQHQHQEEEEVSNSEDLVLNESLRRRLMNDEIEFVFRLELVNSGYDVFKCVIETQLTDFYCIRVGPLTAFIAEFTLL